MKLKSLIITFLTVSTILACSKQKFSNAPSESCERADSCQVNPDGTETYSEVITVAQPNNKVDILFVVDNSGSMTEEQAEIANKFSGFVTNLRNPITGQTLDYRIAIATTDNQSGSQEWKDGKLVPFRSSPTTATSYYWIDNVTPNQTSLFANTIRRPESLRCYQNGYSANTCARIENISGDERGILTAVKAANRYTQSPLSFIRSDAALHVIFVSDEDERSNGGTIAGPIETNDKPETLVNALNALPSASTRKRFVLHSIINTPNELTSYDAFLQGGFEACVERQTQITTGSEFQGCHYALASVLTGGEIGHINANSYSAILNGAIAASIQDTSLAQVDLRCVPLSVTITNVNGSPYPQSLPNPFSPQTDTRYIAFNPPLPAGSVIRVTYTCPRRR